MTAATEIREQTKLDEHVARLVAEAPPLSDDQRARLALLLRPTKVGAA